MKHIALIGCAHIHTPNFVKKLASRTDVRVDMVWDHDAERAKKNAEQLPHSRVIAAMDEAFDDKSIDAVVICSETDRHSDLVVGAAEAKKYMFVEKPLGIGAKDAYRMASAIEKAGVMFQTGYFMRGSSIHQFLRKAIADGKFGKITRIRHTNCHQGSLKGWFDTEWRWMADIRQAGCGAFGDLGTHSLDILLWLMGEAASVTANVHVATSRYGNTDEYGEGLVEFKSGAVGSLAGGWVDIAHPVSVIVSGTEGHAYVANGQLFVQGERFGSDGKNPLTELPPALPHAFDLFLDAVTGAKCELVGAREAAYRSAVMEAMYDSARTKKWVSPK
ncbi:MAG: Gfo/Idh/MocA family oxidoreductase [Spirochaetota bacterium]